MASSVCCKTPLLKLKAQRRDCSGPWSMGCSPAPRDSAYTSAPSRRRYGHRGSGGDVAPFADIWNAIVSDGYAPTGPGYRVKRPALMASSIK